VNVPWAKAEQHQQPDQGETPAKQMAPNGTVVVIFGALAAPRRIPAY